MKTWKMTILSIVGICALAAVAARAEGNPPVKVPAMFNTVYVPGGFDDNDNVQIIGEGMFKNACYRPAETKVKVDVSAKVIYLGPVAYEYNGFCLQVILPFERVIDVGVLPKGDYEVRQLYDNAKLGSMHIKKATTDNPDDYLYAPISQAYFKQEGGTSKVLLSGDFPNSCMYLQEVKVELQSKVIVVQPIADVANRRDCKAGKFHFEKVVEVYNVPTGHYLLHVRSMNAKAMNNMVDVP